MPNDKKFENFPQKLRKIKRFGIQGDEFESKMRYKFKEISKAKSKVIEAARLISSIVFTTFFYSLVKHQI